MALDHTHNASKKSLLIPKGNIKKKSLNWLMIPWSSYLEDDEIHCLAVCRSSFQPAVSAMESVERPWSLCFSLFSNRPIVSAFLPDPCAKPEHNKYDTAISHFLFDISTVDFDLHLHCAHVYRMGKQTIYSHE